MAAAATDNREQRGRKLELSGLPPGGAAPGEVVGDVTYRCVSEGHEWTCRATLIAGQMDPAAHGRGDDCPRCGLECDQVVDFVPDDYAAYQALNDYEEARRAF